jgi:hypothetical protein
MMQGVPSVEELSVVVLLFLVLLVFGIFFLVRGFKMPPDFEKNMAKRKELRRKVEENEEKNKGNE